MRGFQSLCTRGGLMLAGVYLAGMGLCTAPAVAGDEPKQITFFGSSTSSISSGVAVPDDRAYYYSSGTVPAALDPPPTDGSNPFGDTKTQAISILGRIELLLEEAGLTIEDVVYLRAYLTPDPAKGNVVDYTGWFDAYALFFNNPENPVKTARSTVGVVSLVDPNWLIEVEAVAVYPRLRDKKGP
ncbi:MAG: translation initiation inhibitor, yjgF family protein [Gemmatimonadaceae bacterium]|nr:translation initiation inhibitor, yjgF family protein [Gloeobacterales cyanobacterium ES-bin-141]